MEKVLLYLLINMQRFLCQERTPIIQLTDGSKIQGAVSSAHEGKLVSEYLGIPYAQPPVHDRRFEVPLPVRPWDYILNATSMPKSCYQTLTNGSPNTIDIMNGRSDFYDMSEDCLYLNIWVPRTSIADPLPVTFYVHGGSFMKGSSAQNVHNGKFLAAEMDAVVVTFNYRLAMFGFLCTGFDEDTTNMGIRDQIEAFRWVAKNIAAFGGDPTKITLVGNSAGAASVGFLSTVPDIQSKVRRMIMYSGVPNAPWASQERYKALRTSMWLAKQVNCSSNMALSTVAINCLKKTDPTILVRYSTSEENGLDLIWKPVIDDKIVKSDHNIVNNNSIDVVIGTTSNEAGSFVGRMLSTKAGYLSKLPSNLLVAILHQEIKKFFPYQVPSGDMSRILTNLMRLYGPPDNVEFNFTHLVSALNNMASDYLFNCPADRLAKDYAKHGQTVYKYVFDHMVSTKIYPTSWGVVHTADLPIIFCNPLDNDNPKNAKFKQSEIKLSRIMAQFLSTFQRTGDKYDQLVKNELSERSKLKNKSRASNEKPLKPDLGLYIPPHRKSLDAYVKHNDNFFPEVSIQENIPNNINKSVQVQMYVEDNKESKSLKKQKPGTQLYIPPHRKVPQ